MLIVYFAEIENLRVFLPRKDKKLFDKYRNNGYDIYYQVNDDEVVHVATPTEYIIPYDELP